MDTWFTTEPMICSILKEGLEVIGMVKQLNQRYIYGGEEYTLPGLKKFMQHETADTILGSIIMSTNGELFYMFCDDIQDMDLTNALKSLMALFVEQINAIASHSINNVISKLQDWIASQASYIQALFTNLSWKVE